MIAIIDYGAGNLQSVEKALRYIGCECQTTSDPAALLAAGAAILPGVGAFGDTMKNLRAQGLEEPIKAYIQSGRPFLGICLGLQVLFESSEESPGVPGLGVLKGKIVRLPEGPGLKIPHIGWNGLLFPENRSPLFEDVREGACVYFVHSFYGADCGQSVIARTEYGALLTAAVARDNVYGVQFHPEKSGPVGLTILKAFCRL